MAEGSKICPICGSANHRNAVVCNTCGTTLRDIPAATSPAQAEGHAPVYDFRHGETDLLETSVRQRGQLYLIGGIVGLILLMCGGLALFFGPLLAEIFPGGANVNVILETATHTPRPTIALATVTPGPPTQTPSPTASVTPTATETSTPEPCIKKVAAGDDLISLAIACGHRSMDVMDTILELNNLDDPSRIQVGQEIIIPWPTPTVDPAAVETETPVDAASSGGDAAVVADNATPEGDTLAFDPFGPTATWTLQPGVAWHRVISGETIISIAVNYGANVRILSELNPEITFSQCDFGLDSGGGSCVVNLYQGQLMRVPAATATPTLPPTPSGSETATPAPTATFNAPSALSPADRAFFTRGELVTLRWVATGTLNDGETYRVTVENLTGEQVYAADTDSQYFIVPVDWQGTDAQRYEYRWTVSLILRGQPNAPIYVAEPRTFIWEGKAGSEA